MLQTHWLRGLPWRVFRRARRSSVQVGIYRSASHLVAARVRLDADAGYGIEQLEAVDLKTQRDEAAVAQLIHTGILRNAPAILVLGAENYNTYPLPAPMVPAAEMREALRWKLRDMLPYSPEDAVVEFVPLGRNEDSNAAGNLLAVAAPRRSVAQAVSPLLAAGVDVQVVDIAEMAQANLLGELPGAESGRALLGLDETSALLTVVHQGELCLARRIQIPRAPDGEEDDPEHIASRIATQVQRSLEVVERNSGLAPVRSVWIGPHPYCALIARCTTEQSGLECPQLDLQAELRFDATAREPAPQLAAAALIAIGAGLRSEHSAAANSPTRETPALSWLARLKPA